MIQQYNLKTGLKLFEDKCEKDVTKELTQLHDMETSIPMDPTKITKKDIVEALSPLMILVDKRGGTVKARFCVFGSKRRETNRKEDSASPTVALGIIMITLAI